MRVRYAGIGYSYNAELDGLSLLNLMHHGHLIMELLDWVSPLGAIPTLTDEELSWFIL